MDIKNLKNVVGSVSAGNPAIMHLYGVIDSISCQEFVDEFLWVQDYIQPSKIVVCINTEGGSVISGMGVYSAILNCPIDTETIIDGIAASMGSIIWAAGKSGYMRDYSILMIHNPFTESDPNEVDPNTVEMNRVFKAQIESIYHSRFGLNRAKIREIMDGKEGIDGTWFSAKEAETAGILPPGHTIASCKQTRDKIKASIGSEKDVKKLQSIMNMIVSEEDKNKPEPEEKPIQKKVLNNSNNMAELENKTAFSSIAAQLGVANDECGVAKAITRVADLLTAEKEVATLKNTIEQANVTLAGVKTSLQNVTNDLTVAKTKLKVYEDKEKTEKEAAIDTLIKDAVEAGKLTEEKAGEWKKMAETNFDLVKSTIEGIPGRDKISDKIAGDLENTHGDSKELDEAVKNVVGPDFKFKHLGD